ncbi:hypothetical protein BCR41DRAFT_132534 [Lobosporangium transversale]|uniref:Uncharacterized protein n=1 Tax=Lobosporangium transversale TaxID=64571 RepID=A0A1Y2GHP8_9FUNG|nr:hypothetical protein BCR41DRAFT_132534 [Lobosporangium transversale]ORZ10014.1 hypothetical protein BCR41DRAFT_132534 [Lobosporangium transversale]|eukprot:XP_021879104.1 hypothetical protein BCR41DRAFT_132534 [Lobosporangium transversale]
MTFVTCSFLSRLFIYESQDPSPFTIGSLLPERWWQENAWGILDHLTQGVPHCYMLPGELAGIESTARKNAGRYSSNEKKPTKKQMGKRGDMFWRSFNEPKMDWAVVESAKAWDITGDKYIVESTSKLPRQLHDILVNRTREVGSMNMMRKAVVPGLVIGGPVIQQIWLAWGLSGVNVTRIFKYKATRLESSVDMLSQSMDAIYSMLCFRQDIKIQ